MRKIINSKKCNNCGKELPEDSEFCQYCGSNNLRTEEQQVEIVKECISCGKELPDDSTFCQYCGSNHISTKRVPLKKIKKCGNCGKALPDDSTFCQYCGSNNLIIDYQKEIENYSKNINYLEPDTKSAEKRKGKHLSTKVIIVLAIVILVFLIGGLLFGQRADEIPFRNGNRIIRDPFYYHYAGAEARYYEYEFNAPSNKNLYVYIIEENSNSVLSFLVEKNNSYSISLSKGQYKVYYAAGGKWYGKEKLFGITTEYYQEKEVLNTADLPDGYGWVTSFEPLDDSIEKIPKRNFPD